jgi:hypothetical protein
VDETFLYYACPNPVEKLGEQRDRSFRDEGQQCNGRKRISGCLGFSLSEDSANGIEALDPVEAGFFGRDFPGCIPI